eukprot:Pgem_evm1s5798
MASLGGLSVGSCTGYEILRKIEKRTRGAKNVTPISGQVQLQIPLTTYPLTLISGQISATYLPLDV